MDSSIPEFLASDRNTGTGRIELSSQGSSGQDAYFGVSSQVTDELLFNSDFESAVIRYLLLLFMLFCYLFLLFCYCFYSLRFLLLLCGDVEINRGPQSKCRLLFHNFRGLKCNLNDLQIAFRDYDIILCSETMVSYRRHISEILIPDFNKPTLLLKSTGN